jgi:glycerol-3-phosphate dehydrogenase
VGDGEVTDARTVDVLVVGGGINGVGIARDLAGRGLSVLLAERDDLAAHTSSASTKLIHGGLRYLEHREFALVRKALQEREVLLRSAPHLMWPLRFVLPHDASMRPAWMIRAGLFLYDHLARREVLPGSQAVDLRTHPAGASLLPRWGRGFIYADGWADDARLVVACATDARERGATILPRTRCVAALREAQGWRVTLEGAGLAARGSLTHGSHRMEVRARAMVNAAGPWAADFLAQAVRDAAGQPPAPRALRRVQGSHIVIRRRLGHDHAYLFQSPDRRVIFAIPYEGEFTLIGTTDHEVRGELGRAAATDAEVAYLCEQASRWLAQPVTPADVVWRYAGVRPLLDDESGDPSAVTRDYRLELDRAAAPLLNVWGGKLTTFRALAEEAADQLAAALGCSAPAWTRAALLPGGDLSAWIGPPQRPDADFARFVEATARRWPWLPSALARRLARAYGGRIERVIGDATSLDDLGAEVAPGVREAELKHLVREEWARSGEDVLWRRSKLGLHLDEAARRRVGDWMAAVTSAPAQGA